MISYKERPTVDDDLSLIAFASDHFGNKLVHAIKCLKQVTPDKLHRSTTTCFIVSQCIGIL